MLTRRDRRCPTAAAAANVRHSRPATLPCAPRARRYYPQHMIRTFRRLPILSTLFGFAPRRLGATGRGTPAFWRDSRKLRRQYRASDKEFPFGRFSPYIGEGASESGTASGHYFHQDLLVAQWVFQDNPTRHVDVGSRTDG